MLQAYREHAAERAALGIPALPLDAAQTAEHSGGLKRQKHRLCSGARGHLTECFEVALRNEVLNGVARVALDRLRNQPDGFGLCLSNPNPCLRLAFGLENGRLLLAFWSQSLPPTQRPLSLHCDPSVAKGERLHWVGNRHSQFPQPSSSCLCD